MAKRVKTAHQQNIEAANDPNHKTESLEESRVKVFFIALFEWVVKWSAVSFILALAFYFVFNLTILDTLNYTSLANFIILILIIASSAISGNTAVMSPMLYVGGTGAIEDMHSAKSRAYSFMLPLAILIHALVFQFLFFAFYSL